MTQAENNLRCPQCLFCVEMSEQTIRCCNADVADEAGWQEIYQVQGFLDLPYPEPQDEPCFWYVHKR